MAKIKLLRFTPDLILSDCKMPGIYAREIVENPLPDDAECVGVNVEINPQCIVLTIHSETFPDVEEGAHIPEVDPIKFKRSGRASVSQEWSSQVRENHAAQWFDRGKS